MRYIHLRRVATIAAACTLSLVTLAAPAGASGAPTGNAAAIRAYVKASATMNKQPFMEFLIKSYYYLGYNSNGSWNMAWGYPKAPKSYEKHVNATEITASSGGKIVWIEMTFDYACPSGSICVSTLTPLRFYVTKTAAYYAVLDGPNNTPVCWTNATKTWVKTDFEAYGDPNWYPGTATKYLTASNFLPATTVGSTTTFVSTYEYTSDKSKVTETDTENDTTHLFTHSTIDVGKGDSKSYPAYNYSQSMSTLKGVKAPKISRIC